MESGHILCGEWGTPEEEVADGPLEPEEPGAGTSSHIEKVKLQEEQNQGCSLITRVWVCVCVCVCVCMTSHIQCNLGNNGVSAGNRVLNTSDWTRPLSCV